MIRRRWRLLLVLTLLLLVGGLALVPGVRWPVYGWLGGEAFYQGTPTSWWAAEIRENYQPTLTLSALLVVGRLAPEAAGASSVAGSTQWRCENPAPLMDRIQERLGFGTTGNTATTLQALVLKVMTDAFLVDGDAMALPILLDLLRNGDARVRWLAVNGLAALKPMPPKVVPALVAAVDDEDPHVRDETRMALRRIDPEAAAKAGVK